ncbi:GH25 family lysozyme [Specibacter cremeus]|uniref:GH25 family lysozyme n=1 Tax=Specibacter cremeus TaxID=1629051 RepID=UPI000F78FCE7|nr:GH25 family lysozyme [Specibacter cremeus]
MSQHHPHRATPLRDNTPRRVVARTSAGLIAASLALTLGISPVFATTTPPPPGQPSASAGTTAAADSIVTPSPTPRTLATTPPSSTPAATAPAAPQASPDAADVAKYGAYMGMSLSKGISSRERHLRGTVNEKRLKSVSSAAEPMSASGTPAGVLGMDVSGWQADATTHTVSQVDWSRQWALGARFVYIKATEGTSFKDASFSSHYTGASKVGMLRGAYHFARPDQSGGVTQANFFVDNGGGWSADGKTMPPLLDMEDYSGLPHCYGYSAAQMVAWIKSFSNQVLARTGRLPMIYTNYYWWQDCTGNSTAFTNQPLHIAAYGTTNPLMPGGWSTYSVWQYSDNGPFAGDSNVWNGTLAGLQKFATAGSASLPAPSIASPGDVVAADTSGTLWDYPSDGAGGFGDRRKIGNGWLGLRSINVIDWNADGTFDLVAQWTNGKVNVYLGSPSGGFDVGPTLATSGWAGSQLTIGYWLSSSNYPQILARSATGALTLWPNPSGAGLGAPRTIGNGWGGLNLVMVDYDGDGNQDVLAQDSAGALWLYRSDGRGNFTQETPRVVGNGWNTMTSLSIGTGFAGAGSVGIVARTKAGALLYYPVPGNSTIGSARQIGNGWGSFLIAGGETINAGPAQPAPSPSPTPAPSKPAPKPTPAPSIPAAADVVAVDSRGILWRYPVTTGHIGMPVQIGAGFVGTISVHVVDWDADGTLDLLVQWSSGRLSVYRGAARGGFELPITMDASGWAGRDITAGRWTTATRLPSIVSREPDGTLRSYASTGTGLGPATQIGVGFGGMHPIMVDADGDGRVDIVTLDYVNRLTLFRSNGAGAFIAETPRRLDGGPVSPGQLLPATGFASVGMAGLLARTAGGQLVHYSLTSAGLGRATQVGTGWSAFTIAGSKVLTRSAPLASTSDVLTIDASGGLWDRPATGNGRYGAPYQIGFGFTGIKSIHAVDYNADGVADVLAQWNNGAVAVFYGRATGGFADKHPLAAGGWSGVDFVTGPWSGQRFPGLVGTNAVGNLFYWPNTDGASIGSPQQIGNGWGGLRLAMIDFDRNGTQDVLAVDRAGYMRLYRGTGRGGFVPEDRPVVGHGWGAVRQFRGTTSFTSGSGVTALMNTGELRYYPLVSAGTWGMPSTTT